MTTLSLDRIYERVTRLEVERARTFLHSVRVHLTEDVGQEGAPVPRQPGFLADEIIVDSGCRLFPQGDYVFLS